jgi:hypothetical protein
MRPCPSIIGGARVVCYTPIDERHIKTENTVHLAGEHKIEAPKGLAICQYEGDDAYYLFGCTEVWESKSDTWHETLDDAKSQAEFEYAGTAHTWIPAQ